MNHYASTSQIPLDLYYEQGYSTPSSDFLYTPPQHQSKRPTIDTNFNWNLSEPSNRAYQHRSTYSHTIPDNNPTTAFSMLDSAALPAFLPPSDRNTPPSHPPAPTMNQAPLKLHQPRPSRKIPIISLSNLASACDDLPTTQEPKCNPSHDPSPNFNRASSMLSLPAVGGPNTKYMLYPTNDVYSPTYGVAFDGHFGKAILCNCGCMESYTFR